MNIDYRTLIEKAFEARQRAYCPYSHFAVGAALLTCDGQIFQGCNIENAAYGPSNCAERTAIFKAVSEGAYAFTAIAVVGGQETEEAGAVEYCYPCGVCRQVMLEFCSPEFEIITAIDEKHYQVHTLKDLAPCSFGKKDLSEKHV